ncbi:MAG: hypothetical protein WC764_01280 [Candidatus Paceibacterota bacterium]|jgi:hypothetical protein
MTKLLFQPMGMIPKSPNSSVGGDVLFHVPPEASDRIKVVIAYCQQENNSTPVAHFPPFDPRMLGRRGETSAFTGGLTSATEY